LHSDSFDDRAIEYIGDRYVSHQYNVSADSGIAPNGRTGKGLKLSTGILDVADHLTWQSAAEHQTLYAGIAWEQRYESGALLSIRYNGTPQIFAQLNTDRTISVIRYDGGANTVLATSSRTIPATPVETFFYVELMGKISPTVGAYELRIDGVRWLSGSGLNTSSTGDALANQVRVINTSQVADGAVVVIDDFYISDDSTDSGRAAITGFAGPVHIRCLEETGNGSVIQFTPASNTNASMIDETGGEDADGTYNSGSVHKSADSFVLEDLAIPQATIKAVAVHQWARKEDALYRALAPMALLNTSQYPGDDEPLGATYERVFHAFERNPRTDATWTLSEVNGSMEIGYRVNHSSA
jgi:hypothetical protein